MHYMIRNPCFAGVHYKVTFAKMTIVIRIVLEGHMAVTFMLFVIV